MELECFLWSLIDLICKDFSAQGWKLCITGLILSRKFMLNAYNSREGEGTKCITETESLSEQKGVHTVVLINLDNSGFGTVSYWRAQGEEISLYYNITVVV